MSARDVIISLDIGTSGARALLFDEDLHLVATYRQSYSMTFPRPGWSEQDPEVVFDAVATVLWEAVMSLNPDTDLKAVVISAQMYSVLAVNPAGEPLTASLPWSDTRSADVSARLRAQPWANTIPGATGCPLQPIYPLSKIAWLRENLDLPLSVRFISIKDYVIFRLTGHMLADWSTASASGLLNITTHQWCDEALEAGGISAASLPELAPPRYLLRHWLPDVSDRIGIAPDIPIVLGAGDAPLANLGVGALSRDTVAVNVGTSAAARVIIKEPRPDPTGRLWTYVVDEGLWVKGGIAGSGGAAYDWLLGHLISPMEASDIYALADELAASVQPGADGLLFIPYFTGEQSPGWNASMRGMMVGLGLHHTRGHIIRAALEGLAFVLLRVVKAVEMEEVSIRRAVVTGGINASSVWQQILANVFGRPISVPTTTEGSARGAAMLGWVALGRQPDYRAFQQEQTLNKQREPDAAAHAIYRRQFSSFLGVLDQFQFTYRKENSYD